jgi:alkylhydroperoxidase family enzyme
MSRISLTSIEHQPEPIRSDPIREFTARRGNLNVFRLLANAPNVFAGWTQMVDELFDSPTFSLRTREVVILRVAHLQGSRYENGHFGGVELAVLMLTSELLTTRTVSAAVFDEVQDALGSETTVELLMVINRYSGLALMLNALDVDLDDSARLPIPQTRQQES